MATPIQEAADRRYFSIYPFAWGRVNEVHEIGVTTEEGTRYAIVEYQPHQRGTKRVDPSAPTLFHVYVDGRDTNTSTHSLETALIYALATRSLGPNPEGWSMICRALKLGE